MYCISFTQKETGSSPNYPLTRCWILSKFRAAGHPAPEGYGHWLVDSLLEETLELFGAMFFLAALVAFYNSVIRTSKVPAHHPGPV
jgi:hypothetical protein